MRRERGHGACVARRPLLCCCEVITRLIMRSSELMSAPRTGFTSSEAPEYANSVREAATRRVGIHDSRHNGGRRPDGAPGSQHPPGEKHRPNHAEHPCDHQRRHYRVVCQRRGLARR